jgi:hypothetical protein
MAHADLANKAGRRLETRRTAAPAAERAPVLGHLRARPRMGHLRRSNTKSHEREAKSAEPVGAAPASTLPQAPMSTLSICFGDTGGAGSGSGGAGSARKPWSTIAR